MRLNVDKSQMKLTAMPDGTDGTKCVKAYLGDHKLTVYLNLEPGEIDYTGYAKNRAGVGYRLHLVRNANLAPRTIVLEVQDEPDPEVAYKIMLVCSDERGLPLKSRANETYRVPVIVFDTAHEAAEYEEYLVANYDEDSRPIYSVHSWQEGTPIPMPEPEEKEPDEEISSDDLEELCPNLF